MPLVLSRMLSLNATVSLPLSNHRLKLTCAALSPPVWKQSRRRLITVSLFLSRFLLPNDAIAGSLIDKYVKRKKLDPLEAYVPPVFLAQLQIQDLEKFLNVEKPEFEACRSLLRSGPASSLRVNIRAVAQYASDAGYSETASADVDRCLRALEEMDSLFLRASRKDPNATVELMKSQLGTALTALDSLLQTVPSPVLDKGKAMAEVYRSPSEQDDLSESSEIQQLQSIL
ncbi:hypothetical protein EUTSA_v10002091mg [Eutrema salsugineum]|uniref:DUF7880 domain-containing protein n=1 Tax=Eutrema salsugineum TaxID=72664 RepID=V4M240_EUTSA|nr:uncharacterized protein LOC18025483 [Eutrema salsugineum]ESQ50204.1 hypothetical protein EUTSA_v10002091mg [Eutrema salsugineum]